MPKILLAFASVTLTSSLSLAQESPSEAAEKVAGAEARAAKTSENAGYLNRPFAIELQGAPLGGPLGIVGMALNYAPVQNLAFEAGAGMGGFGPQLGAAIRPKLVIGEGIALELSAGYSYGDYKEIGFADGAYLFRNCSWVNADLGFEWRSPGRVVLRAFFGVSKLMSSKAPVWHDVDVVPNTESNFGSTGERYPLLPYLGLAVGYYFWI